MEALGARGVARMCGGEYLLAPSCQQPSSLYSSPLQPHFSYSWSGGVRCTALMLVRSAKVGLSRNVHRMSLKSNPGFGPRLRAHREQRRITLGALAESIKVKASLLEGLERNDVSGWPPGIYRRALVREYAKAIGLPANPILEEFCELFPEPGERHDATVSRHNFATVADAELRMTLAEAPTQAPRLLGRLFGVVGEFAGVLAIGYLAMLISGSAFWTASGLVALVWYPSTAVLRGEVTWYRVLRLQRLKTLRWSRAHISPAAANLMSVVTTAVGDSAVDPVILETDVHTPTSASASVH